MENRFSPGAAVLPVPGDLLGSHYRIVAMVHTDARCAVYSAVQVPSNAKVAVHMLVPAKAGNPEAAAQFQADIRHVAGSKDAELRLLDVGSANGLPYAVFDWKAGSVRSL